MQVTSTRHGEGGKDVTKQEMGPTVPDMFEQPSQGTCLGLPSPGKEAVPETLIPIHNDARKDTGMEQRVREGVDYPALDSVG
ncbi:hypothetical protein NDU88_007553 [Pleurodeles waltl]|uniref:Uncharacterized protein n=1 Tax=Pleurodeles waltl TaxID=8319 RepID=A0AAV7N2D6_PLEWA|nr:hypothetical protein NDU88_007553 [Pleurodeles waltl]